MRTYQPGDEAAWAALINTGDLGRWTAERAANDLTGRPQFDPAGLFLIESHQQQLVASACAWLLTADETDTGILHMVCAHPHHRARGLGYAASLAVLHRSHTRGFRSVVLSTHHWRLGAIKTYLRLGFQPVYNHPQDPQHSPKILTNIGWTQPIASLQNNPHVRDA